MNLPVPNLDDRRFQDLVDEAKSKIPEYCPAWTNHNVSDPGVALIELFAWMTEMSIFRLNQVPDTFYTRMLNMLGFTPFQKKAATADLIFWLTSDELRDPVEVPKDTEVGTVGLVGDPRVFATMDRLLISPPRFVAALTHASGTPDDRVDDAWIDLKVDPNSALICFPSAPPFDEERPGAGAAFYLGFEESLARRAIRLDIVADKRGTGIAPAQPPIVWEAWTGDRTGDGWQECEVPAHDRFGHPGDTTGGINKDGHILLLMADQHAPRKLGDRSDELYWLRARLTASDHPYERSPRIEDLHVRTVGGRIRAEHSRPITNEVLGISNGKPGQTFQLANPPLFSVDPGDRRDDEWIRIGAPTPTFDEAEEPVWKERTNFSEADKDTLCYVIDPATGTVRFGPSIRHPDGTTTQHGAIPPIGSQISIKGYRTGGGDLGNVGPRTINGLRNSLSFVAAVTNFDAATGGVDAETVEEAKRRGPEAIRAGDRAVTKSDFERLTRDADRDVKRVVCIPPRQPGDAIEIAIVPAIADEAKQHPLKSYVLPEDLADNVRTHLDARRLLSDNIDVRPFHFQGVSVVARVSAEPIAAGRSQENADGTLHLRLIEERVDAALSRFINPLTGGMRGDGWPIGTALTAADVRQVIDAVEGVKFVHTVVLFDYDLGYDAGRGQRAPNAMGKEIIRLRENTLFLGAQHEIAVTVE